MNCEYTEIEVYKGIPICSNDGQIHIGHCYKEYKSVEAARTQIDSMLEAREKRAKFLDDNTSQVFDMNRGECLKIGEELYTINVLVEAPKDKPYMKDAEYICIHNSRGSKYANPMFRKLFDNRVQDSVEAIRAGEGDFMLAKNFFGMRSVRVARFLDREIGERVRASTIEGFKNSKFITTVKMFFNYGFGSSFDIGKDDALVNGAFDEYVNPRAFDSEDEAHQYIEQLTKRIKDKAAVITEEGLLELVAEESSGPNAFIQGVLAEYRKLHSEDQDVAPSTAFSFDITQALVMK